MNLPEFYLEPFLPPRGESRQVGCDLACGWGRASLTLRDYRQRHIYCCDLSQGNLDRLAELAERAGLRDKVSPRKCDVTSLPFGEEEFDFFQAFDIFEHLTDTALDQMLTEILRCARKGAILYAEIPLHAYCPPLTHIQDFSFEEVVDFLQGHSACGRRFRLLNHDSRIPDHFTYSVDAVRTSGG
jgi:ubiquinone/menaquinone biosynthesis C-methylase UbiE